ncbi:MAG: hypothetical protein NVSMB29_19450 [Candidatus Dormibacteria bacterium]
MDDDRSPVDRTAAPVADPPATPSSPASSMAPGRQAASHGPDSPHSQAQVTTAKGRPPHLSRGSAATAGGPPQLAKDIELVGEYEDSGFKEAPYIVRRADGQTVQLTQLLYLVAEACDGRRDYAAIAEHVGSTFGRRVSAENVATLVDQKLRPLGVLAMPDGTSVELKRNDPMTALTFRAGLVPEGAVAAITTVFRPLFFPPVIVAVLAGIGAFDAWLFFSHGLAQGFRQMLTTPALLIVMLGLVILSAAFHESGHATACRYGGAKPGVMGAGLYMVWPAFYTDVTDAYRLGKGGRVRCDLGGVYFNLIFSLATAGLYVLTRQEFLLVVIMVQHVEIVHQFLPFLRLDGYYLVADLTGVPDLFARMKPTLRSMLPWRGTEKSVEALKPWVRWTVTGWVLLTIPAILFIYGFMVTQAPRIFATAWDSGRHLLDQAGGDLHHGSFGGVLFAVLQLILLALPVVGLALTLVRTAKTAAVAGWQRTEGRPVLRSGFAVTAVAAAVILVSGWSSGRNYRAITPQDTGTLTAGFVTLRQDVSPGGSLDIRQRLSGGSTQPGAAPASSAPAGNGAPAASPANGQPASSPAPSSAAGGPSATPARAGASPTP